ncbi:MAG: hypothetical protein KF795_18410 [Labilithrix sp.]|nr:hypothetical protein [Labilithrix sp.]
MGSPLPAAVLDDLRRFLERGLSLLAVTRDANMMPAIARCGGARLGDDQLLRVLVCVPEGVRALENIDANGAIAFSVVLPTTYRTLQIKGSDARRIDWPGHEAVALAHRPAFQREVAGLGFPPAIAGLLWSKNYVPVGFTPLEVFDQTPGPHAGLALIV